MQFRITKIFHAPIRIDSRNLLPGERHAAQIVIVIAQSVRADFSGDSNATYSITLLLEERRAAQSIKNFSRQTDA